MTTADGITLRAEVRSPRGHGKSVGTIVLAHAMFARRSEFVRPGGEGLAPFLAQRGWTVVTFDFRGHGDSALRAGSGDTWGYDDLVRHDLPSVVAAARLRFSHGPLVVVGHSLGGHVAIAAQATRRIEADRVALFAANIWARELDPSRVRRAAKRAILSAIVAVSARRGFFPARAMGLGSDDESLAYMRDLARFGRLDAWRSADGADHYAAATRAMRTPVLAIASAAERINCHPECAARFVDLCGGDRTFRRVERSDDGGPPPGHMELLTSPRALREWDYMERWARGIA